MRARLSAKRRSDGATFAMWAAGMLLAAPMVLYPAQIISRADMNPGFFVFFCWAALCTAAVLRNRMVIWAILCCGVMTMVSLDWWLKGPPQTDNFGFGAIDAIVLFLGSAIVVAATGVLTITLTAIDARRDGI